MAAPTRRALFGAGLAVAAISAPAITVAATSADDAELYRLFAALAATQEEVERADLAWMKAEALRSEIEGDPPQVLRKTDRDYAAGLHMGNWKAGSIHTDLEKATKARDYNAKLYAGIGINKWSMERCAEVVEAITAWEAHKENAYQRSGTGPAYDAMEQLQWAEEKAAAALQDYRPRTMTGLRLKAEYVKDRIAAHGEINEWQAAWARSLVEDAISLSGA